MRGLAIATLFLGLCLADSDGVDGRALLIFIRGVVFFIALIVIWFGA